jgi:hypothetical protein
MIPCKPPFAREKQTHDTLQEQLVVVVFREQYEGRKSTCFYTQTIHIFKHGGDGKEGQWRFQRGGRSFSLRKQLSNAIALYLLLSRRNDVARLTSSKVFVGPVLSMHVGRNPNKRCNQSQWMPSSWRGCWH